MLSDSTHQLPFDLRQRVCKSRDEFGLSRTLESVRSNFNAENKNANFFCGEFLQISECPHVILMQAIIVYRQPSLS